MDERLDSWKEIAAYLKRDVSTVQRWEVREHMPVHRHLHDKLGSVYAFRSELDQWRAARAERASDHPLAGARFVRLTDFEGTEQAAAISRDGKFVAFLSDRDGPVDVWLTEAGSGHFSNLTHGSLGELVNPDVRTIGFSPDGKLVTIWVRRLNGSQAPLIDTLAIPIGGGEPALYLKGAAEFAWSNDATRVVYHTIDAGDPMFVNDRAIFTGPEGVHSHFPVWSPDDAFIYFVYGKVPDDMDIWRVPSAGGRPERLTSHKSRVTHPVFVDRETLLYLSTDADGGGPWLYALDLKQRKPRRVSFGVERYTSLAATADGKRFVVTVADTNRTLWRVPIESRAVDESAAARIAAPTNGGRAPRTAAGYLLYVSWSGDGDTLWKLQDGSAAQLWSASHARMIGGAAIATDGKRIAFVTEEYGQRRLCVMNDDGSGLEQLPQPVDPAGTPAWAPDGQSIAVAATINGREALVRVSADGRTIQPLVRSFAADPVWPADGASIMYSGPEIGTTFRIQSVNGADPGITLSRGARRIACLPGQRALVVLRGDMHRQNFALIDLETGRERALTNFAGHFMIADFDISRDGREIVFEREQNNSHLVMIERP